MQFVTVETIKAPEAASVKTAPAEKIDQSLGLIPTVKSSRGARKKNESETPKETD